MKPMTFASKDITERLEDAATEWLDRSALQSIGNPLRYEGWSCAALLGEAKEEILRLRGELALEIKKTNIDLTQRGHTARIYAATVDRESRRRTKNADTDSKDAKAAKG